MDRNMTIFSTDPNRAIDTLTPLKRTECKSVSGRQFGHVFQSRHNYSNF